MTPADLPAVDAIAAVVHPGYPEDPAVFAERLALYGAGCRVLGDRVLAGYVVSHPWHAGRPPRLNSRLGRIPPDAGTYYLHDLALLAAARGSGAGAAAVALLETHARAAGFATLSLTAVNDSGGFWQRLGFLPAEGPSGALASYDGDARMMVRQL